MIIIPAHNEEANIGVVVRKALEYGTVLVVDDGSTDATADNAQCNGASVLSYGGNRGYAAALRAGYAHAIGTGHDYVVQLDADGQHSPRYIPRLFAPVKSGEYDISIGSRFYHPYPVDFVKAVGVLFFRQIVRITTGLHITDTTSGFQCLNKRAMEFYLNNPMVYPDANAIVRAHRAGLRIKEVPVAMRPNHQGRSMHRGAFHLVRYMILVLRDILIEPSF